MSDLTSPWRPPNLRERSDIHDFLYVVVEEEIDGVIGLVVAEWPEADEGGGPRFRPDSDELEIPVERRALQSRLRDRYIPGPGDARDDDPQLSTATEEELRRRRVSVGDVFAIRPATDPPFQAEGIQDCDWIGEVIDVTPDAREAAKARMYEALTPRLDPEIAEELLERRRGLAAGPEVAG